MWLAPGITKGGRHFVALKTERLRITLLTLALFLVLFALDVQLPPFS